MPKNRTPRECELTDCDKQARPGGSICPMHYYRMRRTGTYDPPVKVTFKQTGWGGYEMRREADHILALRNGTVYVHRAVLFEKIGYGPHICTYCATHINWRAGLQCDHVDRDRLNNTPDNLVPSCNVCNTKRAKWRNQFSPPLSSENRVSAA